MQDVSSAFFERTKRVSNNVEGLALEATASQVILANTLTKISLLAHTKFIESVRNIVSRCGQEKGEARARSASAKLTSSPPPPPSSPPSVLLRKKRHPKKTTKQRKPYCDPP